MLRARNFVTGSPLTNVVMVGAPVNEGQPITGVEKGPDAFRQAGIERVIKSRNFTFEDYGNIPEYEGEDGIGPGLRVQRGRRIGYKVGKVHEYVAKAAAGNNFVLTVGGDHSIGSGTITGVMEHMPIATPLGLVLQATTMACLLRMHLDGLEVRSADLSG